jgi:FHS family L-fucose permease-like MFS transporter
MWGGIFMLSTARLGKYISVATGVFMIGVIGGAILPLLQGILADTFHGWRWTWLIVIFAEMYLLYYATIGSRVKEKDIMDGHVISLNKLEEEKLKDQIV